MKLKTYAILIGASLYERVVDITKGSGALINDYLDDEKNVQHLSLMLYDLLPLSFKFTIRHEKFHKALVLLINNLRSNLVVIESEPVLKEKQEVKVVVVKKPAAPRKPRVKKVKVEVNKE